MEGLNLPALVALVLLAALLVLFWLVGVLFAAAGWLVGLVTALGNTILRVVAWAVYRRRERTASRRPDL